MKIASSSSNIFKVA